MGTPHRRQAREWKSNSCVLVSRWREIGSCLAAWREGGVGVGGGGEGWGGSVARLVGEFVGVGKELKQLVGVPL